MKKVALETITLGPESGPVWSICRGHVDAKTFNKAFGREWDSDNEHTQTDLLYEYWKESKDGTSWRRSAPGRKGAVPVTVAGW